MRYKKILLLHKIDRYSMCITLYWRCSIMPHDNDFKQRYKISKTVTLKSHHLHLFSVPSRSSIIWSILSCSTTDTSWTDENKSGMIHISNQLMGGKKIRKHTNLEYELLSYLANQCRRDSWIYVLYSLWDSCNRQISVIILKQHYGQFL